MSHKTPKQISSFIEANMHRFDVPQQWYGDEPNAYRKDWDSATVRAVVGASWPYEQSAGNQAIPLVYRTINEHREDFLCDRNYFPSTPRDLKILEKAGVPLFGIESRHQYRDFDVVGTSVSYQVLTINYIKQLLMSDIPPTWEDRFDHNEQKVVAGRHRKPEEWPFIIVGGQGYGAPEVLANVVDAWFCGEVEDEPGYPGLGAVMERIADFKQSGRWQTARMDCYADMAREFNFLYFPCFVDVHYAYEDRASVGAVLHDYIGDPPPGWENRDLKPSKQVVGYTSKIEGMRLPVVKRFVHDLDKVEGLSNPPLLYVEPGMGSGDLETQRGCPAWCSFCALTYRQKPYRQRSVDYMVEFGQKLLKNTGGIHLAPFGPDFPMHTQKKRLIKALLENVVDDIDASSMRVDDFIADPSYILLQAYGNMDTVTLGVEGNSQRMRDFVGKGAADEDIKEAVARGIRAGIKKFKLYMIAFMPGETEEDIYHCLNLAKELADIRDSMNSNAIIQLSWTPMLIEANTPFQWFAPTIPNYALGDVWEELRDLRIDFKLGGKAQKDKMLYFQLSQRASREVGKAMVEAVADFNAGCWGGAPRGLYEAVEQRLVHHGFLNGKADCYDERQKNDMFGWEFIDQGINIELMWVTYQQMREFLENTRAESYDSNFSDDYHGNEWIERCDTKCYGKLCGTCGREDLKIRRNYIQGAAEEVTVDLNNVKVIDQKSVVMKVRAKVVKSEAKRFVMNDHWRYAIRRAAYRAGMPITKRTVRFSSDAIKFKDFTCGVDFVEFGTTRRLSQRQVAEYIEGMNAELGSDIQITDFTIHPANSDPLRADVDLSLYDMEIEVSEEEAAQAIEAWYAADYVKMILHQDTRSGVVLREEVNGKDFVEDLWVVRDGHRLRLRMMVRGKASPYVVYAALFGKASWLDAARRPAFRVEAFVNHDPNQIDFFRPACERCERAIPVNLLDKPFDLDHCPKCRDEEQSELVSA